MKSKWCKHIIIFLCAFILCGFALWSMWQLWFNPYRGTVSDLRPSEELMDVSVPAKDALAETMRIIEKAR